MGTSKTARASMVQTVGEKKVISDEVYVKNLRYDVNNGIHATQEGAKALLRAYDALLPVNDELVAVRAENANLRVALVKANDAFEGLSQTTNASASLLEVANARVAELEAEIAKIKEVLNA
ncbi:MAG TPA: hypothetical protein VN843_29320 [Anaerolineales bacterium]|nr:hypothetical protein [Anaerolineales bacterium]